MTNIRKGRLEELPRHSGARVGAGDPYAYTLPLGRSLALRPAGSAVGRGRSYLAAARRTVSPVQPAPSATAAPEQPSLDLIELLEVILKGREERSTAGQMQQDSGVLVAPDQVNETAFRGRSYSPPASTAWHAEPAEVEFPEPDLLPNDSVKLTSATAEYAHAASEPPNAASTGLATAEVESLEQRPQQTSSAESVVGQTAPFLSVLLASTEKRKHRAESQDDFRPIPAPVRKSSAAALAPSLARGWEWLRKNQRLTSKKQLRVSDTVGLGEKRFVALLHFEGRKFVIGGGASSVSLLTELGEATTVPGAMQPALLSGSAE